LIQVNATSAAPLHSFGMNTVTKIAPQGAIEAVQASLQSRRRDLADRIAGIERSRRRSEAPLSADSEERAGECENDEVLDRLADTTRSELDQVSRALERLAAGQYGICERCSDDIGQTRLKAVPEATCCTTCAGARP
jgi:RNA polymerase-binding transcription factor DksA